MEEVLFAIEEVNSQAKEEGVLDSFLRNVRHLLSTGFIATTILASVANLPTDYSRSSYEPLTELIIQSESMDKAHTEDMMNRLAAFISLKAGWNNDEQSQPIDPAVIDFLEQVIASSDPVDWQNWLVFPEQRGSVMLDYEADNCRASISVGNDGFSYMAYGTGYFDTAERVGLSGVELLSFVRKVKEYGRA